MSMVGTNLGSPLVSPPAPLILIGHDRGTKASQPMVPTASHPVGSVDSDDLGGDDEVHR